MNEKTRAQFRVIRDVRDLLADAGDHGWWLFGGWGLDARIGRITRDHSDIEMWVARRDGDAIGKALVDAGAVPLETQPPEESREFTMAGVMFSTAFFDPRPDGTFVPQGRWSDWVFPAGSFSAPPGQLGAMTVPVMSLEGMVAMKEQYPTLRNGRPLREKDLQDLEHMRELASKLD